MFLISPSRRSFLKLTFALLLLPVVNLLADTVQINDETLTLHISREGEVHNITFIENGEVNEEKYHELCYIFKDVHADVAVKMDIELFKILARGQLWLAQYGYNQPLIITSAYRTLQTNLSTEGAVYNSLHLYGKAADLKYPGLPIYYLASLFRSFGASGIGLYSTFLHVDTWKERVWRG